VLVGQKKAVAIAVRNVSGGGRSSASGCGQNRLSHDSSAWRIEPWSKRTFLQHPYCRQWLDGVEQDSTLLALQFAGRAVATQRSLHRPRTRQTADCLMTLIWSSALWLF
jgi:hypothetical protein